MSAELIGGIIASVLLVVAGSALKNPAWAWYFKVAIVAVGALVGAVALAAFTANTGDWWKDWGAIFAVASTIYVTIWNRLTINGVSIEQKLRDFDLFKFLGKLIPKKA